MGLMDKLFKGDGKKPGQSSQFAESQAHTSVEKTKSQNAPRRDLVRIVLADTMRKHGIPSDWLDCRSLSVLTKNHKSGMHVQFLVRQGDHQLLQWIHAFQESFWERITRTDPTAHEWLFSVGWEFYGKSEQGFEVMPAAATWKREGGPDTQASQEFSDTLPPEAGDDHDALETDLAALQHLVSMPADLADLPDAAPRKHKKV
jgi:hypothetical protein